MTKNQKPTEAPQPTTTADQEAAAKEMMDAIANVAASMPEQPELTPQQKLEMQVASLTDLLKRSQAEFANYQKRMEQQSNQMVSFAGQRILTKVIPIFDMFDMAIKHKDNVTEFVSGVEMIHHSFAQLLKDEQVVQPELVGAKFDGRVAQAVGTRVVKGKPAGIVVEETAKGYVLNDRTIKHAKVIVSADENQQSQNPANGEKTK